MTFMEKFKEKYIHPHPILSYLPPNLWTFKNKMSISRENHLFQVKNE